MIAIDTAAENGPTECHRTAREICMDLNWTEEHSARANTVSECQPKEEIITWETVKNEKLMPSPICVGRVRVANAQFHWFHSKQKRAEQLIEILCVAVVRRFTAAIYILLIPVLDWCAFFSPYRFNENALHELSAEKCRGWELINGRALKARTLMLAHMQRTASPYIIRLLMRKHNIKSVPLMSSFYYGPVERYKVAKAAPCVQQIITTGQSFFIHNVF